MNILTTFRKLAKYRKVRLSNISCVYMCGVNGCVCLHVYGYMCVHKYLEASGWCPKSSLISLHLIYSGGVSQLNLLLTDNLSLASQPARVMSLLS